MYICNDIYFPYLHVIPILYLNIQVPTIKQSQANEKSSKSIHTTGVYSQILGHSPLQPGKVKNFLRQRKWKTAGTTSTLYDLVRGLSVDTGWYCSGLTSCVILGTVARRDLIFHIYGLKNLVTIQWILNNISSKIVAYRIPVLAIGPSIMQ